MHILLTRPLEDCEDLILKFKELNHKVSILPVIKIKKKNYENINFSDYKGIVFTSSNAVKNLETSSIDKSIECFCVGYATERSARLKGFQKVYSADGNVSNLREIIIRNFNNNSGNLIYVSGEKISSDLSGQLSRDGYSIKRLINYEAVPVTVVNIDFIDNLKLSVPEIVYVYSENSANSLLDIIKKYKLTDNWMNTNLMCIGEKSSSILNEIKWKKIFLFSPGEEEFLLYKI